MKYGILVHGTSGNVGDAVQSLAAVRFLPRVDRLVERVARRAPKNLARLEQWNNVAGEEVSGGGAAELTDCDAELIVVGEALAEFREGE